MATLLFWSIVLIPVGVFAFWCSLQRKLSTRKLPLPCPLQFGIFAWAAVHRRGLAIKCLKAL